MPEGSGKVDGGVWEDGFYKCTMEDTRKSLRQKNVPTNRVKFEKGWFEKILTPELATSKIIERNSKKLLPVVMVDCDTYPSSKSVFEYITALKFDQPFVLVLDDYRLFDTDLIEAGESQAFVEWAKANKNLKIKRIHSYNRKSEAFLVTSR